LANRRIIVNDEYFADGRSGLSHHSDDPLKVAVKPPRHIAG
jgi:hypothetical protein